MVVGLCSSAGVAAVVAIAVFFASFAGCLCFRGLPTLPVRFFFFATEDMATFEIVSWRDLLGILNGRLRHEVRADSCPDSYNVRLTAELPAQ